MDSRWILAVIGCNRGLACASVPIGASEGRMNDRRKRFNPDDECSFCTYRGGRDWHVRGPVSQVREGAVVTIVRADRATVQKRVGAIVWTDGAVAVARILAVPVERREFDAPTVRAAMARQGAGCALCGRPFGDDVRRHAHHGDGDSTNAVLENCVLVCDLCHLPVHGGVWRGAVVLPLEAYPFLCFGRDGHPSGDAAAAWGHRKSPTPPMRPTPTRRVRKRRRSASERRTE